MEDQIDLVDKTRRRLTRLYGVQKLEKIAMGTIIRGMNPYAAHIPRNHLATYLSYNMCDKIFQRLLVEMKESPERNKFQCLLKIPFLLSANTKYLDLDAFLPKGESYHRQEQLPIIENQEMDVILGVMDAVKKQAPNIEHIVLNSRNIDIFNEKHLALIDYLTDLKHLKIIEMKRFYLETHHVAKLCKNLPQLQILDIFGFEVFALAVTEDEIKQSFGNLRLLVCCTSDIREEMKLQIPLLNFASHFGESAVETTFSTITYEDFLESQTEKGPPAQRKIYFSCDEDWFKSPDMDVHEQHPDVTYLQIDFLGAKKITPALPLPNFSKIKTLIIYRSCFDTAALTKILRFYGPDLQSLCLEADRHERDIDMQIFELCPKVESLQLEGLDFGETSMSLENIPHLKELYLEVNRYQRGSFLPKMLSSPRLHKLHIYDGVFYEEDLVELNTMVTTGQILQELEALTIDTYPNDMTIDAFQKLLAFLENVSAFLPKLKDIKFIFEGDDYVDVAKRLKRGQNYHINEIKAMIVSNKTLVPILESFGKLRR